MLSDFLGYLTRLPLMARFALAMAIILIVPSLCRKVRLPAVVGLLLAGVVFGPHGLHVGPKSHEVAHFFADVGKLLLMFFAGLEIDLVQFRRTGNRSLVFGVATFTLPLASGMAAGLVFGYGWLGALLIGSLLASHTLLGYPVAQQLGVSRDEAVLVTVGATIFTDVASLMILAVCIPIHVSGFSASSFLLQLTELALYVPLVLFGLGGLTQRLIRFRRVFGLGKMRQTVFPHGGLLNVRRRPPYSGSTPRSRPGHPQKRLWASSAAQAVVLAKQGRTAQDIADALGCSLKAVKNWVAQYNRGGIQALHERPHCGRPLRLDPQEYPRLKQRLDAPPRPEDAGFVPSGDAISNGSWSRNSAF